MRSVLRYPGGKTRPHVQEKILSHMPAEFDEYREPFVGGGGVFFAIPADLAQTRWINDYNKALIEFYKAMANRPKEFIELCRSIPPIQEGEPMVVSREKSKPSSKQYNARLKAKFDELKYNEECDQALRYFFINRTVWAGRVNYDPKFESRMYFSNPQGWNIVARKNRLEQVAEHLEGTKITSGDYSVLLEAPGKNVVLYLDPPYVVDTYLAEKSKQYQFGFKEEDHRLLAERVKQCKHNICMSYDDFVHPKTKVNLVRELYGNDSRFHIHKTEWAYSGTQVKKGEKEEKKKGQELIITNYEIDPKNSLWVRIHERGVPFEEDEEENLSNAS